MYTKTCTCRSVDQLGCSSTCTTPSRVRPSHGVWRTPGLALRKYWSTSTPKRSFLLAGSTYAICGLDLSVREGDSGSESQRWPISELDWMSTNPNRIVAHVTEATIKVTQRDVQHNGDLESPIYRYLMLGGRVFKFFCRNSWGFLELKIIFLGEWVKLMVWKRFSCKSSLRLS